MAEITAAAAGSRPGARHGKRLSTRVDLTPMVDLGFLLITFFIFTTTMSEPSAMKLIMPADGDETPVKQSGSLTVIPCKNNRIFFYHGILDEALQAGGYGMVGYSYADGIGKVIRDKKKAMETLKTMPGPELMLIIKPLNSASYRNVVDVLDEMTINEVKSYALAELSPEERNTLAKMAID